MSTSNLIVAGFTAIVAISPLSGWTLDIHSDNTRTVLEVDRACSDAKTLVPVRELIKSIETQYRVRVLMYENSIDHDELVPGCYSGDSPIGTVQHALRPFNVVYVTTAANAQELSQIYILGRSTVTQSRKSPAPDISLEGAGRADQSHKSSESVTGATQRIRELVQNTNGLYSQGFAISIPTADISAQARQYAHYSLDDIRNQKGIILSMGDKEIYSVPSLVQFQDPENFRWYGSNYVLENQDAVSYVEVSLFFANGQATGKLQIHDKTYNVFPVETGNPSLGYVALEVDKTKLPPSID